MQKSAKFILPLLLTAALLFGFTGCADKNETPTNPTTEAATAESTAAPTTPVTLQAPVMETEDWDAYTPTKYQDKEHLSVTLNLTADLTAQHHPVPKRQQICGAGRRNRARQRPDRL